MLFTAPGRNVNGPADCTKRRSPDGFDGEFIPHGSNSDQENPGSTPFVAQFKVSESAGNM
ncbi:hypothetical protein D3C87_516350 [compost metagenome]